MNILAALPCGKIVDRFGRKRPLTIAWFLFIPGLVGFVIVGDLSNGLEPRRIIPSITISFVPNLVEIDNLVLPVSTASAACSSFLIKALV
ncbi:MAG: hypothetical protein P8X91_07020 [Candidatus Bathyarchaeota archaeon]